MGEAPSLSHCRHEEGECAWDDRDERHSASCVRVRGDKGEGQP